MAGASAASVSVLSGNPARSHSSSVVDLAAYRATRRPEAFPAQTLHRARIYRPAPGVKQAGRRRTRAWVLEFEPISRPTADPLMGWIGSADPAQQVRLAFPTKARAIAFAERRGWFYEVWDSEPADGVSAVVLAQSSQRRIADSSLKGPGRSSVIPLSG